jgi:hypothetical protein
VGRVARQRWWLGSAAAKHEGVAACCPFSIRLSVTHPALPVCRPPLALCLQITGGMLNGVSPNYRDMAPALRAITSVSYNRCVACPLCALPALHCLYCLAASSVVQSLALLPAAPLADACMHC